MSEFFFRKCPKCGDPKNELTDGQEYILRCRCDWQAGYIERFFRTVHKEFHGKTLNDWSPDIFKGNAVTSFKSLIKVQKALAIEQLNSFYYKKSDKRADRIVCYVSS